MCVIDASLFSPVIHSLFLLLTGKGFWGMIDKSNVQLLVFPVSLKITVKF
tara:strand:- start:516 stop:665 length:150 start_codon:yes stop_codon:yes gene_type:complete